MDPVHPTDPPEAPPPGAPSPDSFSSDALREIRARAEAALRGQKELASDFENRVEQCLSEIADGLEKQLSEEQTQQLESLEADRQELQQQREEIDALRAELEDKRRKLDEEQQSIEQERDKVLEERDDWDRESSKTLEELEREIQLATEQREQIDADLARIEAERQSFAEQAEELAEARERLALGQAAVEDQRARIEAAQQQHSEEERQLHERCESLESQLTAANQALEQAQAEAGAIQAECEAAKSERDKALSQAAAAEGSSGETESELEALRAKLDSVVAERDASSERLSLATKALQKAQERLEAEDTEAMQKRFDLAVADAQELRQRIDQLEQELAERPSADAQDSAEATRLREQCDELKQRVKELEERPPVESVDASEEVSDLHRRFEMAVEDVRQLKQEKAELEEQLASASSGSANAIIGDDWEAQKRRMLASLEGEGEPATEERAQERATVEGTIKITDEVIASKDQEIARLKQQLDSAEDIEPAIVVEESFDDDQRLEAERNRMNELNAKLEENLRQAELELSVERAKIAREKTQIEEMRIDMDAMKNSLAKGGAPAEGDGKRQSNWLKKLGLGGDEG